MSSPSRVSSRISADPTRRSWSALSVLGVGRTGCDPSRPVRAAESGNVGHSGAECSTDAGAVQVNVTDQEMLDDLLCTDQLILPEGM